MTEIIEVRGVSKSYGGVVANKDISIDVKKGGITGLIGPTFRQDHAVQFDCRLSSNRWWIDQVRRHRDLKLQVPEIARLGFCARPADPHLWCDDCVETCDLNC